MRVFAVVPAVSLLLTAATSYAQAPAAPKPTAPAGQSAPAPRPPAQTPAAPRQSDPPPAAAVAPAPIVPFRDGAKFGYINVQAIASQSADGKAAGVKIKAFQDGKARDLESKQKSLDSKQQRLASGGNVLSEATRAQLQTDIEREGRELNRLAEDADQDLERMTQQLQAEFMSKLSPVLRRVAMEKKVDFVFTDQSGIVFAAEDLNLTADVIRALDSAAPTSPAAAAPPAATPPAPASPSSSAKPLAPAAPAAAPAATAPK
jgi:outer membrane protein